VTTHWLHIAAAWGLTGASFSALAIAAALRQRRATATLKRLDPRAELRGESRAESPGESRAGRNR
jgi:hypothetical protein